MEWISLGVSVGVSLGGALLVAYGMLSKYREKVDQLEKKVEKLEDKVNDTHSKVATQEALLSVATKNIDKLSGNADSHSPLALTEKGQKLVKNSGFAKVYDTIKDDLLRELEAEEPRSQYDVQEKARTMMSLKTDDPRFKEVEDWAFKNGEDLAQILRLGGLKLRDYYFEKHPEIVNPKEQY